MARKNYKVDEVLKGLSTKHDVKISGTTILVLSDKVYDTKTKQSVDNPKKRWDLGNGSWGKIDFLTNHCGYFVKRVDSFDREEKKQ